MKLYILVTALMFSFAATATINEHREDDKQSKKIARLITISIYVGMIVWAVSLVLGEGEP